MGACHVTLAHVTWALAREWALSIRIAKTVTWALNREWALARDTMVYWCVGISHFHPSVPMVQMDGTDSRNMHVYWYIGRSLFHPSIPMVQMDLTVVAHNIHVRVYWYICACCISHPSVTLVYINEQ